MCCYGVSLAGVEPAKSLRSERSAFTYLTTGTYFALSRIRDLTSSCICAAGQNGSSTSSIHFSPGRQTHVHIVLLIENNSVFFLHEVIAMTDHDHVEAVSQRPVASFASCLPEFWISTQKLQLRRMRYLFHVTPTGFEPAVTCISGMPVYLDCGTGPWS